MKKYYYNRTSYCSSNRCKHLFYHHAVTKTNDDLIIDGLPDPVTIDLSKVFTNGTPKEVDSMTIQTNEKGLVTSIETKDEMVSFKYNNTKTRAIVVPNVFMKVERNGKATVYIIKSSSFLLLHDDKTNVAPITAAVRSAIVIVFFIVLFML